MKPRTVAELLDYLEACPLLRRCEAPDGTFRARVDRRCNVIWEGKTASYIPLTGISLDGTGFTVPTIAGEARFEYAEGE